MFGHAGHRVSGRERPSQRHTYNSLCDLPNEPDAVLIGFAQAKDAARADTDPRFAHGRDGAQSLVVRPRGDHLAKKNQKPILYNGRNCELLIFELFKKGNKNNITIAANNTKTPPNLSRIKRNIA